MYTIEKITKKVTVENLLKYYDGNKVENYCKNCQNYEKIWSCPPHKFNTYDYLTQYNEVKLYAVKIIFEDETLTKEQKLEIFQVERKIFSDELMSLEDETSEALISGNCYQCDICQRTENKPCILEDKKRYSLEALGLLVGDVTSKLLNLELDWTQNGFMSYLTTVGALLIKK
ncbi:MAG: hypothetical protein JEZ08_08115 [Clostridiales bacterium]|nr:hypothetical protein [Clostridiales bacterium]